MHRHLITATLACFGSNLFAQAPDTAANQAPGTLNKTQNTLQNGLQRAQDAVDRIVPKNSGSSELSDGINSSQSNGQNQINGRIGNAENAGVQSDTNAQNLLDRQPGQINSNLSTQGQRQSAVGEQQRNGVVQDSSNQNGNVYQGNRSSGSQSSAFPGQGQSTQSSQFSNQAISPGTMQNNGTIQNNGTMQNNGTTQNMPNTPMRNSSPNSNIQQPSSSSNIDGRVFVLRFDARGREFICVDGRSIYFDIVNSVSAQGNSGTQNQYRAGYGSYESKNGRNMQDQSRDGDQLKSESRTSGSSQSTSKESTNPGTVDPVNSNNRINAPEVTPPERDRLRLDNPNEAKGRKNNGETQSDVDVNSDVIDSNKTSNNVTDPKS